MSMGSSSFRTLRRALVMGGAALLIAAQPPPARSKAPQGTSYAIIPFERGTDAMNVEEAGLVVSRARMLDAIFFETAKPLARRIERYERMSSTAITADRKYLFFHRNFNEGGRLLEIRSADSIKALAMPHDVWADLSPNEPRTVPVVTGYAFVNAERVSGNIWIGLWRHRTPGYFCNMVALFDGADGMCEGGRDHVPLGWTRMPASRVSTPFTHHTLDFVLVYAPGGKRMGLASYSIGPEHLKETLGAC